MLMQQLELIGKAEDGLHCLVAWVDASRKVKRGNFITLKDCKDPQQEWLVLSVGAPQERKSIHQDWHAGGL